ncbi:putative late blight resistance protein homolog R1A-10 isoform X2 [Sesamum indicum]|uniref:Late blight resistance protein homolog R1A-10 isoform X2 n=1 Tax=Sesamum indicum TaxID=4182 RepID=A0A8M8UVV0_SESIN|nr:putative late blight resistance protein homolog R1A-10 isoform X2 [Sesamum indicum]
MEDTCVRFQLENLNRLRLHQADLISDVKDQIERLEKNLLLFKTFLNESTEKRGILKEMIREVVYKAEDAVDVYVSQALEKETEKYFRRASDPPAKLLDVVEEVESTAQRVQENFSRLLSESELLIGDASDRTPTQLQNLERNQVVYQGSSMRQDTVVGIEDETNKIIGYLIEETEKLDVISIVGMPGLGKTTLARKVFRHPRIEYEFPIRLWVSVSQVYRVKDIFLGMLRDLSWITEDMYDKTVQEIARTLHARLEKEKFLIILDDMWTTEAWDDLRHAFPIRSNKSNKILITSRSRVVGQAINPNRESHCLRFLTYEESWMLLRYLVFGHRNCPQELEVIERVIVDMCCGLPLLIMLVGGVLAKTASTGEMKVMQSSWKKVAESSKTFDYSDMEKRFQQIVLFSYNALPSNLKPCFLYLRMFPEDFEISSKRLILLWIAEGYIEQKTEISLEEIAKQYLEDLISRNLVMTDKLSTTGEIKICRVHDLIRDFCVTVAYEHYFQEIHGHGGEVHAYSISNLQRMRHIAIDFNNVINFISSQPYGPRVRSILCSLREEIILLPTNVSAIADAFKLTRVLDVRSIRFTRFPFYLTQLVHLRYIALTSDFKVLPEAISKWWSIQTIIVFTSSRVLEIKADIWKMVHLRHLKTNASVILQNAGAGGNGEKIQTLVNISPQSCTDNLFERAINLKKLGIRGQLTMLLDDKGGSTTFDNLGKLQQLEKLKLLNDLHIHPKEAKLPGLPPPHIFPKKLISLTLSYTLLGWEQMSVLGMLENLKVLKLKNDAFTGERWEAADGGFQQLEVLQIEYADLVFWEASSHHFPKLQHLSLRNCEELKALPFGLADILSLQVIDLHRTTKLAAVSAREIQADNKGRRLKLSIFPSYE